MRLWSDPHTRRWFLWGLLGLVFVLVNVHRLSSAVLADDLMAAFETTGGQLGTLHATFFWVYAVMQIPTGIMADRIGPRRTATVGGLTMSAGALAFALANSYPAAIVGRGLVGLGGSVIFVCILRFAANWFQADEFGTVSGLTFAVAGIGGVFATAPLAVIVEATGWRTSVAGLGVVGLVASIAVFAFVRDGPEDAGLRAIEGVPEQPTLSVDDLRRNAGYVLRDRWTWVVGAMLFCTSGINLTVFGMWGIPYVVQTYDVSVTYASLYTMMGAIGIIVGPPSIGWLSDRLGRRTELMVAGTVGYTGGLALIAVTGSPPLPVIGGVFFMSGALFGAFVLGYAVVQERHPTSVSGISTGTINGTAFLGAAVLPTLMGWALDTYWTGEFSGGVRVYTSTGYRMAFAIATAGALVALSCAVWLHLNRGDLAEPGELEEREDVPESA